MLRRIALVVLALATFAGAHTIPCTRNCTVNVGTFTFLPNVGGGTQTAFFVKLTDPSYFSTPLTLSKVTFAIKGNISATGPIAVDPTIGLQLLVFGGGNGNPAADCTQNDCIFADFQIIVNNGQPFTIVGKSGNKYLFYGVGEGLIIPPFGRAVIQPGDKANVYLHLISTTLRW